MSHSLLFKMPRKLGFLGLDRVMKCTDDTLSICECIIILIFEKLYKIILCKNKLLFDELPTFLANNPLALYKNKMMHCIY